MRIGEGRRFSPFALSFPGSTAITWTHMAITALKFDQPMKDVSRER